MLPAVMTLRERKRSNNFLESESFRNFSKICNMNSETSALIIKKCEMKRAICALNSKICEVPGVSKNVSVETRE